jgi:hypothetical protein
MRKTILAAVAALSLGGCVTAGPAPAPFPTDPANIINRVQTEAVAVCGFLPTAQTVADMFLSGNTTVQAISTWASAICSAVTPKAGVRRASGAGFGRVNGVPVRGKFV